MAVPVHVLFYDNGGSLIKGSCDVQDREGSIEIRGLTHNLSIPTDPLSGHNQYVGRTLKVNGSFCRDTYNDTRNCPGTGHLESIQLRYEKATWIYCDGNIQFSDAWNERASA